MPSNEQLDSTPAIPNMEFLRKTKSRYRSLPIDVTDVRYSEPVVPISDYGIAGQSYYSRPNATFDKPLEGVGSHILLRESVVQTLAKINDHLAERAMTRYFGKEVELYVEEGIRLYNVQSHLFYNAIPHLIREQNPDLLTHEIDEKVAAVIAKPTQNIHSPSPHSTGGAFDLILREKQTTPSFVEGAALHFGFKDGELGSVIQPDYYEKYLSTHKDDDIARQNRRAFYAIMTGQTSDLRTNFSVNPDEIWHWSRGDQLASHVSGRPAYYSIPPSLPPRSR